MVALWGPMAIDLYRAKFGPQESGGYIRMVELADQSFSGTSCMTPNLLSLPDLARWGQEATRKAVTD